jgi:hypothetical protein
VDWAETEKVAIANGVPDASTKINDFKTFYYGPTGSTSAREHLVVMQSFKHVVDQKVACGRPWNKSSVFTLLKPVMGLVSLYWIQNWKSLL